MDEPERLWMRRALELAERGRGLVEPNPLVGAVIVKDGRIVGEGWHEKFGAAHAEVQALAAAGQQARGGLLLVTLEPCCHQGKTPPCTRAIVQAGLQRILAAHLDPFPAVAGQGVAELRAAGLEVQVGLCEAEARHLNAPYLTLLTRHRPYVIAKWAMSLDGKICTHRGDSRWISNESARQKVHALRGRVDGIVVGIGTVLADDPLLTARPPGQRCAVRIVLDSAGRSPISSRLVQSARQFPVLIATAQENPQIQALQAAGCEILLLHGGERRTDLGQLLLELGRRRMTNILVEGGAAVLGAFFDAGAVDEVWCFVAPMIVGGRGKSPVGGSGSETIASAQTLSQWELEEVDGNLLFRAFPRGSIGRDA